MRGVACPQGLASGVPSAGDGVVRAYFFCIPALILAGCSDGRDAGTSARASAERDVGGAVLIRGNGTEPESLDPHLVRGAPEWAILTALFEGLTRQDPGTGLTVPAAARSWEVSEDGRVYRFLLDPSRRWSNGDPVTAEDWLYSARRILSPALGSTHTEDTLFFVRGARMHQTGGTSFETVGIRSPEPGVLEFELEERTPFFPSALVTFFPVHRATVEAAGAMDQRGTQWARTGTLVSNGPFRLVTWRPGVSVDVERNPHHPEASDIRLAGVRYLPVENPRTEETLFRSGEMHITASVPLSSLRALESRSAPELRTVGDLGVYFYSINVSRPGLGDPRVRRALSLAVDRLQLAEEVLGGGRRPAVGFCPPGLGDHPASSIVMEDLERARRLLAEAGHPGGEGLPVFRLLVDGRDAHRVVAEAVQQLWRERLGIQVQIETQETRSLIAAKRAMDFDLIRGSWNASTYTDPWFFLGPWITGGLYNESKWSDERYDRLMAEARAAADPAVRREILLRAEALLVEEAPVVPLYFSASTFLMAPEVRGWQPRAFADRLVRHLWLGGRE